MRITGPHVTSNLLDEFDAFLKARHTSLTEIIRAAGLPYAETATFENNEIPLEDYAAILEAAAQHTASPCLGAEWGAVYPVGATGAYGYMLINAPTLQEALNVTVRYLSLVVHPVAIDLEISEAGARLSWSLTRSLRGRATQYVLFATAATVVRFRAIAGPDWNPVSVQLACPEQPCTALFARIFGPSVSFGTTHTRVLIEQDSLARINSFSDPRLFRMMRELGDDLIKSRAMETRLTRVARRAIANRLGQEDISLEAIASVLKLSPRTLQSRLAAEGTTFEAVVQLTKQKIAENYLRDTDLPLTEIALHLGFSELSAFTRASLRWFGKPPSVLRQLLRGAPQLTQQDTGDPN